MGWERRASRMAQHSAVSRKEPNETSMRLTMAPVGALPTVGKGMS